MTILPCPLCGNEPILLLERVRCQTLGCSLIGPENDQTGEKWNQMAVYVMAGKLLEAETNIAYLGGMQWGWSTEDGHAIFGTWEGCVKDAYKTLMKEPK
ncbi:MAG: hypothetical protein ACYDBI_05870 [Thermoplasmataceae archaeon]